MDRLVEVFLNTEKTEDFFSLKIDRESIWPFIRLETFRLIERQIRNGDLVAVPYRQKFREDPRTYTESEKAAYENSVIDSKLPCDVLVVNAKHRMVRMNGSVFCPVTGMIESLCTDMKFSYCTQVYQSSSYSADSDLTEINHNRIRRHAEWDFDNQTVKRTVDDIAKGLQKHYDIIPDERFRRDLCEMIHYVWECSCFSRFYSEMLKRVSPKLLIVSSYYSVINMIIIREANRLGIPTVEMQHGTIGNEHVAYNCIAGDVTNDAAPKYMLVYGRFEQDVMRSFVARKNIYKVGNPFLNSLRDHRPAGNSACKSLLVISFISDNEDLIRFTLQMRELDSNMRIVYRFHPEERIDAAVIRQFESEEIECSSDFSVSIYELIMDCDYCIGTLSTALYEALCFKKPSFVLSRDVAESDLREAEKFLPHVSSAEEFSRLIAHSESRDDTERIAEYFYEPDTGLLRKALRSIMKENQH